MNLVQNSGGEALEKLEKELSVARDENRELKKQINELSSQLNYEREKLKSLELTMQSLTAGKEEMIARDKAAAEERAEQQRAREAQYAAMLHEMEEKAKDREMRLKSEMNQSRSEWTKKERDLNDNLDNIKRTKEKEIEALRK
jgi:hypothetical protein